MHIKAEWMKINGKQIVKKCDITLFRIALKLIPETEAERKRVRTTTTWSLMMKDQMPQKYLNSRVTQKAMLDLTYNSIFILLLRSDSKFGAPGFRL